MYIYFNFKKDKIIENVIYEDKNVLVCGNLNKVYFFTLKNNKKIFIYGEVYYFVYPDEKIKHISLSEKKEICRIFGEYNIEEIMKRLEGIYVGVIIDRDGKSTMFQDKYSRQDLFWTQENRSFCFSTDLDEIVKFKEKIEYDQMALYSFLQLNYTPKKHTIYKNVNRLGINEIVLFDGENIKFKNIKTEPIKIIDYKENDLERYWKIFQNSVYSRALKNENWVQVSGGWDSSFILATLLKEFDKSKIIPIIGVMNYSKKTGPYNPYEVEKVKKICKTYGLKPEIIVWDLASSSSRKYWDEIKNDMKKYYLYYFGAYGAYWFGKRAKGKEKVIFNGIMGDSIHNFGYAQFITVIHSVLSFSEYADKMACYLYGPTFFTKVLNGTYKDDFAYQFFKWLYKNIQFIDNLNNKSSLLERYVLPFIFGSPRTPFVETFNSGVFTKYGRRKVKKWLSNEYLNPLYENIKPETFYYWLLYCYQNFHFQSYSAKQWRLGANYYGVEGRDPYFDMQLIDFCSAMPETWGRGLNFNRVKYPLKWCMEHKLKFPIEIIEKAPHSYIMETNKNVRTPTGQLLYESGMVEHFKDTIKTKNYKEILDDKYFNYKFIDKLLDDYLFGKENKTNESFLRCLLSLLLVGYY